MARSIIRHCTPITALLGLLLSGAAMAQASFDDLAAAVDEKAAAPAHSPVEPVVRNRAPTRPLLHSYGAKPNVSVSVGVPLGRHGFVSYSPAFGYYNRGHLGFRGHFRGSRNYYRRGHYCPPGFYGRRGRW